MSPNTPSIHGPDDAGRPRLVHDPVRGLLVRRAFEMIAAGTNTKAEVLQVLADLGLRTRRGRPVSPQTFQKLLRNPFYTGKLTSRLWPEQQVKGDCEPLVSEDLFRRVHDVLGGRRPTVAPYQRNHPDFPLRRFVRCVDLVKARVFEPHLGQRDLLVDRHAGQALQGACWATHGGTAQA